jgi:hypothetical protein
LFLALGCCRSRDPGGQEEAEEDDQGEVNLEAQLREDPELPPEYDSDESIEYLLESPPRKRVHYGEPGYRTCYR